MNWWQQQQKLSIFIRNEIKFRKTLFDTLRNNYTGAVFQMNSAIKTFCNSEWFICVSPVLLHRRHKRNIYTFYHLSTVRLVSHFPHFARVCVCTFWCWCVGLQHFKTWFDAKIIHTEQKQIRNNYTIASIAWKIKEAWDRVATRGNDKMKTMRYILMMLIHKLRTHCEIFGVFIEWFNRNHQIDHHRNFTIKLL